MPFFLFVTRFGANAAKLPMTGFILSGMLLFLTALLPAQTTWDGSESTDWSATGNWSAGVPDAADDVTIPDGMPNDPVISTAAVARSVNVLASGSLIVSSAGSLTINSDASPLFSNSGTVVNEGTVSLNTSGMLRFHRLLNFATGTFTNKNVLQIGNSSGSNYTFRSIYNLGTFINMAGTVNIAASNRAIYLEAGAVFTNNANIECNTGVDNVDSAAVDLVGGGTFNNTPCSATLLITAGPSDEPRIQTSIFAVFNNDGLIIENAKGSSSITTNTGIVQNIGGGGFSITTNTGLLTTFGGKLSACCPPGNVMYVNQNATGNNDGTSWDHAYTDLQSALYSPCPDVTQIWVAAATYNPTLSIDRSISFTMKNGVEILGGFPNTGNPDLDDRNPDPATNGTVLSGEINTAAATDNSYHVIFNNFTSGNPLNSTAVLDGFTITGGYANGAASSGAGMYNAYASPTVRNCTFSGNAIVGTSYGGGMYNTNASPNVSDCTFSGNQGISLTSSGRIHGIGMYNTASSPTITNCTFINNSANDGDHYSYGGGIENANSSPVISGCSFADHTTTFGPGIFNRNSPLDISNCTFTNNEVYTYPGGVNGSGVNTRSSTGDISNCRFINNGGVGSIGIEDGALVEITGCAFSGNTYGIALTDASPNVSNCLFSGNSFGGIVAWFGASAPMVTNCTFSENPQAGLGSVSNYGDNSPVLKNCIIWGSGNALWSSNGKPAITISYSIVKQPSGVYPGTGNLNVDPLFVAPNDPDGPDDGLGTADDGLRLPACSPAVDMGTNTGAPVDDILGNARPFNAVTDMGAYESQDLCIPISVGGAIHWSTDPNQGVKDATVTITGDDTGSDMSDANGDYSVVLNTGGNITITPTKNINKFNGVTAADATRIQQHIAGNGPLGAPFPRIAADVNKSNSITTADAGLITQALLGNQNANNIWNTSWRFVDADYVFPNPNAPWNFPESVSLTGVDDAVTDVDFIGVKLGDVTAPAANPQQRPQPVVLRAPDRVLQAGETVAVAVAVEGYDDIAAFQFVLRFDPEALHLEGVETPAGGTLKAGQFGLANAGELRAASAKETGETLPHGAPWFTLRVTALADGVLLSDLIALDETLLPAEAYTTALYPQPVQLAFGQASTSATDPARESLTLSARPNPANGQTTLRFYLPEAAEAQLRVLDAQGRVVSTYNATYPIGTFEQRVALPAAGLYFAELITPYGTAALKVVGE
ncbi:MAG: right-handed parallel beta-helix repeat-containing protein [Saprospiraceae bacterium]|nr:right-handed parallel beta-helix repeat-containing protein [Saprospiraceae bacterium]